MSISSATRSPSLTEWLQMSDTEIAEYVRPHQLTVKLAIDGTRRHYLLHHPNPTGEVTDLMAYSAHCTDYYVRICESFFALGVKTIIALNLWPPDIARREDQFMQLTLKMSRIALLHPALVALAQRWQAALRLHGDYDVTTTGEPLRDGLTALNDELKMLTPEQDRLLLFGFYTGQYEDEMIARTLHLYHGLQRPPTAAELHRSAFPDGPKHIDIYINGGWMTTDNWSIPPLLNQQSIAMYILAHLVLDIQASTMRRLLYDCLFVRRKVSLTDNLSYTGLPLQQLSDYYQQHAYCFVGSGELVGPNLWYPEHVHQPANNETLVDETVADSVKTQQANSTGAV